MSDQALDITMDQVIEQYRDEVNKQLSEKLLLQAAVKLLGEQKTELRQQVQQLSVDLQAALVANQPFDQDAEQPLMTNEHGPVPSTWQTNQDPGRQTNRDPGGTLST